MHEKENERVRSRKEKIKGEPAERERKGGQEEGRQEGGKGKDKEGRKIGSKDDGTEVRNNE